MATKKITELTELTSVADDDYLPIVDTSGATTKKITRLNFIAGLTPSGSIIAYGGNVAPADWLICDGTAVSRTTYATLFATIGTTYGTGDGSTTFNLPNLLGRAIVGFDAGQIEFNAIGKTGGAKTVNLAHSHTAQSAGNHTHVTDVQGFHNHGMSQAITTNALADRVYNLASAGVPGHYHDIYGSGSHQHTAQTAGAHTHTTDSQLTTTSIIQPYITINYIIKT